MPQKLIISLPLYQVEIEGDHETEVIKRAAFWMSLPTKCPICKRPLRLNYRTPKTFQYYELACTGDTEIHSVNLGESIGTHNLYFDPKKEWHTYRPGETPGDIERRQESSSGPVTPERASPQAATAPPDPIIEKRNKLLTAIRDCQKANLRCGYASGDVSGFTPEQLDAAIQHCGMLLLNGRAVPAEQGK